MNKKENLRTSHHYNFSVLAGLRPVGGGEVGRLLLQPDGLRLLPQRGRQVRRPHRRGRTDLQGGDSIENKGEMINESIINCEM